MASSSGEATPDMLNENVMIFFQSLSPSNSQVMLSSFFEENKLKVSFSPALENLFLHESFLRIDSLTPKGLSDSVLMIDSIICNNLLHRSLVLDFKKI